MEIYSYIELPSRVVKLHMNTTTLRSLTFRPMEEITRIPDSNAPSTPTGPSGRSFTNDEDIEDLLATQDAASLSAIGKSWFPGGTISSTKRILDHLIWKTDLVAPPLSGILADTPREYAPIRNGAALAPDVFATPREHTLFHFSRDVLYLRLGNPTPDHNYVHDHGYDCGYDYGYGHDNHVCTSWPTVPEGDDPSAFLSAMEKLRPAHPWWSSVEQLDIVWKEAPGHPFGSWVDNADILRIIACFPGLQLLTIHGGCGGPEEGQYKAELWVPNFLLTHHTRKRTKLAKLYFRALGGREIPVTEGEIEDDEEEDEGIDTKNKAWRRWYL